MADVSGWLAQKYSILGKTADANANLANTQASVLPGDAAARQGLERSQAYATSQAGAQVAPNAEAQRAEDYAHVGEIGTQGRLLGAQTQNEQRTNNPSNFLLGAYHDDTVRNSLVPGFAHGTSEVKPMDHYCAGGMVAGYANGTPNVPGLNDGIKLQGAPGPGMTQTSGTWGQPTPNQDLRASMAGKMTTKNYAAGTGKVPGQGDGTVDKVPAMLAPGEAVLNKGAAEHFGRDKIAALNAIGHAKMVSEKGSPQPGAPEMSPQPVKNSPPKPASRPQAPGASGKPPGGKEGSPAMKPSPKGATPAGKAPGKPMPAKGPKPQELSKGSHHVMPGKSAKTPAMDPGALQALVGMLGGGAGGGMPAPGGSAPGGPPAPMQGQPPRAQGMV